MKIKTHPNFQNLKSLVHVQVSESYFLVYSLLGALCIWVFEQILDFAVKRSREQELAEPWIQAQQQQETGIAQSVVVTDRRQFGKLRGVGDS